jgi:hypothetical protein
MDNVVLINSSKETDLDFSLTLEGPQTEPKVKFIIKTGKMELGFDCQKGTENNWTVKIPRLDEILKNTAYNYTLMVFVDGYYLEPMKGSVNLQGTPDVYVTKPKNSKLDNDTEEKTVDTLKPDESNVDVSKVKVKTESYITQVPKKGRERSIKEIAESILGQTNLTALTETVLPSDAEVKLKNILKGLK